MGPEVPNVSARGADDVDIRDEVAQRRVGDAEFIEGDEVREPRSRNSPSDPTSRDIEDHVLTGHACFRSWCAACVHGRGRAEKHHGEGRKELEDGSKVPVVSWDYCFQGAGNRISEAGVGQRGDSPDLVIGNRISEAGVGQRGDSPDLVMRDGVTKTIFGSTCEATTLDPSRGSQLVGGAVEPGPHPPTPRAICETADPTCRELRLTDRRRVPHS